MDLLLLLTALLCGLTGVNRPAAIAAPVVEAQRIVQVAQAVAAPARRDGGCRPEGYVAPVPLTLDLGLARAIRRLVTPERRRE